MEVSERLKLGRNLDTYKTAHAATHNLKKLWNQRAEEAFGMVCICEASLLDIQENIDRITRALSVTDEHSNASC